MLLHVQHGLGLNASEAAKQICEVYGPGKVTDRTARNWFSKFRKDETNLKDKPRSGRPNEVDCHVVLSVIEDNPSMTSREKTMLCVFWDRRHVIHWELLEKGQTVDAKLYCAQLSQIRRKMRKGPIILLHDNAKPHTARLTEKKLAEFGWEVLDHPPYSPDLAPSDFHLFRSVEHFLRGKRFENIDEMRVSLGQFFNSKPQEFYRRGFYLLPEKWQRVIDVDGEYFD